MIRSITFPVDKRWIKNPTNTPIATMGARRGAAALTELCIATIGLILTEHFRKAPGRWFFDVVPNHVGGLAPNRWTVTLTRISMGTLDPITGGASMKAIQDAVATWCGVKNERDPVWSWVEPIRQEKRKAGYFGVRIELEDLDPGEPRTVVLASIDRFLWIAKQRIKEAKEGKKIMRDINRTANAAAAGALRVNGKATTTTGARARAEAAFAKATGKPTAHDLRDAAEGALARQRALRLHKRPEGDLTSLRPASIATARSNGSAHETVEQVARRIETANDLESLSPDQRAAVAAYARRKPRPDGDPGEERHARDVAPCVNCGAAIGEPCTALPSESTPGGIRRVFGVHPSRAYAAGLHVDVPPRTPATGPRKLASKVSLPAWLALPWLAVRHARCDATGLVCGAGTHAPGTCADHACDAEETCQDDAERGCYGRGEMPGPFTRYPALDGAEPPAVVRMGVPAEHQARYTQAVTMTRRPEPFTLRGVRVWLYETTGGR